MPKETMIKHCHTIGYTKEYFCIQHNFAEASDTQIMSNLIRVGAEIDISMSSLRNVRNCEKAMF